MFDWIYSNREVFLANYVDIGRNHGIFLNIFLDSAIFPASDVIVDVYC